MDSDEGHPKQKKVAVCRFFKSSGECKNGLDCKFRHIQTDKETSKNDVECRHWKKGVCKRGDHCIYLHSVRTIGSKSNDDHTKDDAVSSQQKTKNAEINICRHWKKGACKNGALCKFSHELQGRVDGGIAAAAAVLETPQNSLSNSNKRSKRDIKSQETEATNPINSDESPATKQCKFWKKTGMCKSGDKCKFAHNELQSAAVTSRGAAQDEQVVAVNKPTNKKERSKLKNNAEPISKKSKEVQLPAVQTLEENKESSASIDGIKPLKTCRFWLKDQCKNGDKCKFSHVSPSSLSIATTKSDLNAERSVRSEKSKLSTQNSLTGSGNENLNKSNEDDVVDSSKKKKNKNRKHLVDNDDTHVLQSVSNEEVFGVKSTATNSGSKSSEEKAVKLCRYWKKYGSCKSGDKCMFLHNTIKTTNFSGEDVSLSANVASVKGGAAFALQFSMKDGTIKEKCHARIGLFGNPSDGFHGKTVSMLIGNFFAVVMLKPSNKLTLLPSEKHDRRKFSSIREHCDHVRLGGYYGGLRLVQATLTKFYECCASAKIPPSRLAQNFTLKYDTNIPRMVGLSGSSAIVVACFRALMRFYQIELDELNISKELLPQFILDIEQNELGITAGLQDRVVQVFGGLVHMNFDKSLLEKQGHGDYTNLNLDLLPPLYLVYDVKAGGDSGKAHSDVRQRWAKGDQTVIGGMMEIADLADEAVLCLMNKDIDKIAPIMKRNFDLRRSLYGDACTGERNLRMVELAQELGLTAKLTGSGGAAVCIRTSPLHHSLSLQASNSSGGQPQGNEEVHSFFSSFSTAITGQHTTSAQPDNNKSASIGDNGSSGNGFNISDYLFTEDEEAKIRQAFLKQGFEFVKVSLPNPLD